MKKLFKQFSFPGGIPSHVAPETPDSIHEGGELGYALAHAYGAAFDNPNLIIACVVGDGEAETGPLVMSWHSNKFFNSTTDGAVLRTFTSLSAMTMECSAVCRFSAATMFARQTCTGHTDRIPQPANGPRRREAVAPFFDEAARTRCQPVASLSRQNIVMCFLRNCEPKIRLILIERNCIL